MKIVIFSARQYDREFMDAANATAGHALRYSETALTPETAVLAAGQEVACIFGNDKADAGVLKLLADGGTRLLALRATGFDNVDLPAAAACGLKVARVANYSPYCVAEHAVALLLAINRKIPRAYNRTRDSNFSLDGLMGFDLHGKTVAIIGVGKIGLSFARIMRGFGCQVLGYDQRPTAAFEALGGHYVPLDEVGAKADIISLHCPLTPQTRHIVNGSMLSGLKHGALLINTSRGGLVDTVAAVAALKSGQLGGLGLDVYEGDASLFYRDLSNTVITDDVFERLLSFPNVIVTGHQAFFTREAMETIWQTTIDNVNEFATGKALTNEIRAS